MRSFMSSDLPHTRSCDNRVAVFRHIMMSFSQHYFMCRMINALAIVSAAAAVVAVNAHGVIPFLQLPSVLSNHFPSDIGNNICKDSSSVFSSPMRSLPTHPARRFMSSVIFRCLHRTSCTSPNIVTPSSFFRITC